MKRTMQAALAIGGFCLASSIGVAFTGTADAMPVMLHPVVGSLTPGVCNDSSATWSTTLTITSSVPNGTAHIEDPASPWSVPVPVNHTYTIEKAAASWTVIVTVSWSDGFKSDPLTLHATRPASGCNPTTTVPKSTTTTTCSQAIPPRTDCVPPTTHATPSTTHLVTTTPTVEPTTVAPVPDSSTVAPSPSSGPGTSTAPTSPTSAAVDIQQGPTGTLPTTGSSSNGLIGLGVGAAFVGAILVLVTRKRAQS